MGNVLGIVGSGTPIFAQFAATVEPGQLKKSVLKKLQDGKAKGPHPQEIPKVVTQPKRQFAKLLKLRIDCLKLNTQPCKTLALSKIQHIKSDRSSRNIIIALKFVINIFCKIAINVLISFSISLNILVKNASGSVTNNNRHCIAATISSTILHS